LERWRSVLVGQGYAALAFEVLSLYIDDIPPADLRRLCEKTYTADGVRHAEIVPLKALEEGFYLEALSNGPTLAFKDMAMQLLGNLFEYELARRGRAAQHSGCHQRRHRQRGRVRHARQARRAGVHAQPARAHEPVPAGADVQPDGREHPQHRHRRGVRRLPGHRQGRQQRPGLQAQVQDRHGQLDQLGAPAGPGGLLLRRLFLRDPIERRSQKVSFCVPSATSATSVRAMWRARWGCPSTA
jgi:hypothetical protein